MKIIRPFAIRLLFLGFPLIVLAAVVPALPAASEAHPILILRLPGAPTIDDAVAQAGGYRVGLTRPPFGQVVHSQDPRFLGRLRASGSFVLLNADKLPNFICGRNA